MASYIGRESGGNGGGKGGLEGGRGGGGGGGAAAKGVGGEIGEYAAVGTVREDEDVLALAVSK